MYLSALTLSLCLPPFYLSTSLSLPHIPFLFFFDNSCLAFSYLVLCLMCVPILSSPLLPSLSYPSLCVLSSLPFPIHSLPSLSSPVCLLSSSPFPPSPVSPLRPGSAWGAQRGHWSTVSPFTPSLQETASTTPSTVRGDPSSPLPTARWDASGLSPTTRRQVRESTR